MKNYFIELNHRSLKNFVAIRGISQSEVERYARDNISDFDYIKISNDPVTVVSHKEGWKPDLSEITGILVR